MQYTTSLAAITPDMLKGFFVGWPSPPSPKTHLKLLLNSYRVVLAIDEEQKKVVGFINAVGDDVLIAYIPLLEVLPEYQKQGIGGELVRLMLQELSDLYMVDLLCDPELQPFYEQMGMHRATGMLRRNFSAQGGRSRRSSTQ